MTFTSTSGSGKVEVPLKNSEHRTTLMSKKAPITTQNVFNKSLILDLNVQMTDKTISNQ